MDERNLAAAQRAQEAAESLGRTLHEKQLAYGDAGAMNLRIWEARLAQYLSRDGRTYKIPRALLAHFGRLTRVDDRIARIVSNPAGDRMGEDPWRDLAGDAIIGHIMPRLEEDKDPRPVPAQMMERALAAVEDAREVFHECGIHELGAEMLDDLVSVARHFFGQQPRDTERADAASRVMRAETEAGGHGPATDSGEFAMSGAQAMAGAAEPFRRCGATTAGFCSRPPGHDGPHRDRDGAVRWGDAPSRCSSTNGVSRCVREEGHPGRFHWSGYGPTREVWEDRPVCGVTYFAHEPLPACVLPPGHDGPHMTQNGGLEWG
jgi:hypothetical protein